MNTGFITIPDSAILCIWKCQDTGQEISITPDWYEQNGTPVSSETGNDMVYLRTEINIETYAKTALELMNKQVI